MYKAYFLKEKPFQHETFITEQLHNTVHILLVVLCIMVFGVAGLVVRRHLHVAAVPEWLTIGANTTLRRLVIGAPVLGIEAVAVMWPLKLLISLR